MKNRTRITAALVAGGVIALAVPTSAQAHVSANATSTAAGSFTVVTFSVPHGCEDSPTQVVTIDLPESILSVTPTVNPLWSVEKISVALDEPIESAPGADPVTERIGQVVYTSTTGGLPDGFRDTFALSLKLPDGEAGDVVAFAVTQTCTEGSEVWEGDDVPSVTLTAGGGDAHAHGETAASADHNADHSTDHSADGTHETNQAAASDGGIDLVARIIGVVGVVIGLIGVTAAIITRRASRASA